MPNPNTDIWSIPYPNDLTYGSGGSHIISTATMTITKGANGVSLIKGNVTHSWRDTYNWHPGLFIYAPVDVQGRLSFNITKIEDSAMYLLQQTGNGMQFDMRSEWSTDFVGSHTSSD